MISNDILDYGILPYLSFIDLHQCKFLSSFWYRQYIADIQQNNSNVSFYIGAINHNLQQLVEDMLRSGGLNRLKIADLRQIQEHALEHNIAVLKIFFKHRQKIYGPRCWIDSIIGIEAAIKDEELFQEFIKYRPSDHHAVLVLFTSSKQEQSIKLIRKYIAAGSINKIFVEELIASYSFESILKHKIPNITREFTKYLTKAFIERFPRRCIQIATDAQNHELISQCIDIIGEEASIYM